MNRRQVLAVWLVMPSISAFGGSTRSTPRGYERVKREREENARANERTSPDAKQPNRRESVGQRKEAERTQEAQQAAERQARAKEFAAKSKETQDAGRKARQDGQVSGAKDVGSESKRPNDTPGQKPSTGGGRAQGKTPG